MVGKTPLIRERLREQRMSNSAIHSYKHCMWACVCVGVCGRVQTCVCEGVGVCGNEMYSLTASIRSSSTLFEGPKITNNKINNRVPRTVSINLLLSH